MVLRETLLQRITNTIKFRWEKTATTARFLLNPSSFRREARRRVRSGDYDDYDVAMISAVNAALEHSIWHPIRRCRAAREAVEEMLGEK